MLSQIYDSLTNLEETWSKYASIYKVSNGQKSKIEKQIGKLE